MRTISFKETMMMTFAITGTVFGVTSTVLHFTPWPHGSDSSRMNNQIAPETIAELPYTAEELTEQSMPVQINIENDKWPKYVHLKSEPNNLYYPIWFNGTPDKITGFTCASFVDSQNRSHIISFSNQ